MEFYIKPKSCLYAILVECDSSTRLSFKKYECIGQKFIIKSNSDKIKVEWSQEVSEFILTEPGTYTITNSSIKRKSLLDKPIKEDKLILKWSYIRDRDMVEKIQLFPIECIILQHCLDVYYHYRISLKDLLTVHPNVDRFEPTPLAQVIKLIFTESFVALWESTKKTIKSKDRKSNVKMIAEFINLIAKVYPTLYAIPKQDGMTVVERLALNGTKFAYCHEELPYGFKPFHTDELDLNKNTLP